MRKEQAVARHIGRIYNQQAVLYKEISDDRFAWQYLEKPAFDKYIPDLYTPNTRVLDIGCGTGLVAKHLISRGIRPSNIIGIDVSSQQLKIARKTTPGVRFISSSADGFELPAGSVDLVTTNTVLHHLDNGQLEQMLDRVYDVLSTNGCYFFVEVDPDHSPEGRDPDNVNKWTNVITPWGTEVPFFNRDPRDLFEILDKHGFDKVSGWPLAILQEGMTDPENYAKYSSRPSRMAARYRKVSAEVRRDRLANTPIPHLTDPSHFQ